MPATAETTLPTVLVLRSADVTPVIFKLVVERPVVVAAVPVALVKLKVVSVEEALETKPAPKFMVVEVDCSPVPRVLNGYAKVEAAGKAERQSVPIQRVLVARVVEVALVVVEFIAVKFWRVVEPRAR